MNTSQSRPRWWNRGVYFWSAIMVLILVLTSWSFVLTQQLQGSGTFFTMDNVSMAGDFLQKFIGLNNENPAYGQPDQWIQALWLSFDTLIMSILGIGMAGIAMLLTIMFGARVRKDGDRTLLPGGLGTSIYVVLRTVYILSRAVPELFWAMFVILILEPGILPGAVALAIHNFGILGKLCAEVVEDVDTSSTESLRSSGAGPYQVLFYAIIPEVTPQFLTYMFYRWESIIRASIVVGFVSAGGLGQQFRLSMSYFQYSNVGLLVFCYFVLVVAVDSLSGLLRGLAKL